jgi:hypothetical protein
MPLKLVNCQLLEGRADAAGRQARTQTLDPGTRSSV